MELNSNSLEHSLNVDEKASDIKIAKIIIIGAGPTALGALHRLYQLRQNQLIPEFDVVVIEQEHEVGGLARTITDPQGFSWDLGIHVTGVSKYPEFLEALSEAVPEWNAVMRCVMADMRHIMDNNGIEHDGAGPSDKAAKRRSDRLFGYVPYPVQNSIPYFPTSVKKECLQELESLHQVQSMIAHEGDANTKKSENFDEFSKNLFGQTLQDIFIRPYNEKVWTVKLHEMSSTWVDGRVPRVDIEKLKRACDIPLAQLGMEESRKKIYFKYPADGCRGIGEVWQRFSKKFPEEIFHFGERVVHIDPEKQKMFTKSAESDLENCYSFDFVISTIPITLLGKIVGLAPKLPLKHSKVVLVGIGIRQPQNDFTRRLSWAYFPSANTVFYRCTILSNFSTEVTPDPEKYWSALCEIGFRSEFPISNKDEVKLIEQTIKDLVTVGILEDEEKVCSRWVQVLPYGYPVPTMDRDEVLFKCHQLLAEHNIYSRGRFGGWRYEISNQDHSFQCGIEIIDKVLLDIPETLYQEVNYENK